MSKKQLANDADYLELMSVLEETKKWITKLQVNVQASIDLQTLSDGELLKKIYWMIDNRDNDEMRDEYICCILSTMTEKSEFNWNIFWQWKYGKDVLTTEEFNILSGIDTWRTLFLTEQISKKKKIIKLVLEKLIKAYKKANA